MSGMMFGGVDGEIVHIKNPGDGEITIKIMGRDYEDDAAVCIAFMGYGNAIEMANHILGIARAVKVAK